MRRVPLRGTALLMLLAVVGCRSRLLSDDSGAISLPLGTYSRCAQGMLNTDGNVFLNIAGFEYGATLTLTQSGTTATATYVDQDGLTRSLRFVATTRSSATLDDASLALSGFSSLCVMGPGDVAAYPARMTLTDGELTSSEGVAFVTLTGDLQAEAGPCGPQSSRASFWILCQERQGGALPVDEGGPPSVAPWPVGQYQCRSQVETFDHVNGTDNSVASSGSGTLTLTQDQAELAARYSGDVTVAGTLHAVATTATTADGAPGQILMTPCVAPIGMGSPTPMALPIAGASFTVVDSTLVVSFAGTMDASSSCPGARVAGSVICSR